jgi:hypothetical protein
VSHQRKSLSNTWILNFSWFYTGKSASASPILAIPALSSDALLTLTSLSLHYAFTGAFTGGEIVLRAVSPLEIRRFIEARASNGTGIFGAAPVRAACTAITLGRGETNARLMQPFGSNSRVHKHSVL